MAGDVWVHWRCSGRSEGAHARSLKERERIGVERWEIEGKFVVHRLAYSADESTRMADEESFEEDEGSGNISQVWQRLLCR
jgi:hypothetical protein